MRTVFVALLVLIAPIAHAGCEDGLLEKLNREFGYPTDSPARIACKAWPLEPSKTIIVLARKVRNSEPLQSAANDEGVFDLDVMVQATESGEILLRDTEKGALISDAFSLQEVGVDGASYPLAKGVSAFGVRARRSNRHGAIESLSLYAVRAGKVVRVLAPLHTLREFWQSDDDKEVSRESKTTGTLALAGSSSHGWNDLIYTQRHLEQELAAQAKPGAPKVVPSVRRFRLRFGGQAYAVPESLVSQQY